MSAFTHTSLSIFTLAPRPSNLSSFCDSSASRLGADLPDPGANGLALRLVYWPGKEDVELLYGYGA